MCPKISPNVSKNLTKCVQTHVPRVSKNVDQQTGCMDGMDGLGGWMGPDKQDRRTGRMNGMDRWDGRTGRMGGTKALDGLGTVWTDWVFVGLFECHVGVI